MSSASFVSNRPENALFLCPAYKNQKTAYKNQKPASSYKKLHKIT